MLIVGLVRLLNNEVFDQRVWASYFLHRRNLRGRRDVDINDAPQPELELPAGDEGKR